MHNIAPTSVVFLPGGKQGGRGGTMDLGLSVNCISTIVLDRYASHNRAWSATVVDWPAMRLCHDLLPRSAPIRMTVAVCLLGGKSITTNLLLFGEHKYLAGALPFQPNHLAVEACLTLPVDAVT
jgi:hypothetical protein